MKTLYALILYLVVGIILAAFIFGVYWMAKNGSYWLWYEDMVKETIREMVRQEALKP